MGIALHNASVHECARVALVAVADNVFLRHSLALHLRPLASRRESSSAASAQSGVGNLLNHLVRRHVEQSLLKCGISALGKIFLNGKGIYVTTVLKHHARLLLIERDLLLGTEYLAILLERQALNMLSVHDCFFNYFFAVLHLYLGVKPALRLDTHQRTAFTESVTAALFKSNAAVFRLLLKFHRAVDSLCFNEFAQFRVNIQRTAGNTACAGTDQNFTGVSVVGSHALLAELF